MFYSCFLAEGRVVILLIVPNIYVVPHIYVVAGRPRPDSWCVPPCCVVLGYIGVICRCRCVVWVVTQVVIVSCLSRVIDIDIYTHIC